MPLVDPVDGDFAERELRVIRRLAPYLGAGLGELAGGRGTADLVVRGLSTKEISKSLHISEYTVQDHLKNVFGKVG